MSGPMDPQDAYWSTLRKSPVFPNAWNAALWEATKLVHDHAFTREEITEALRHMTINEEGER